MKRYECPACAGRRIITLPVPNMKRLHGVTYQSNNPATVLHNFTCDACRGLGRVDCLHCLDAGEVAVATSDGAYDGMEPCSCAAGTALMAQAAIDANKSAWEERLPDYVSLSHARISAGLEPW